MRKDSDPVSRGQRPRELYFSKYRKKKILLLHKKTQTQLENSGNGGVLLKKKISGDN